MKKNKLQEHQPKWKSIIIFFIFLVFLAFLFSGLVSLVIAPAEESGNTGVIRIHGAIAVDPMDAFGVGGASSTDIVKLLEKADEDKQIKVIVLDINSPGGGAVASYEIAQKIKEINKTTVAWIREVGASGGYWIATAADHIIANPMSITGSIGVISSYVEFAGLMDDYNLTYRRFVSGDMKDTGSPLKKLRDVEKDFLQAKLDKTHDYFIANVAENRGLSEDKVRELADGSFYLGSEALDHGLIDELGSMAEVKEYVEKELNATAKFKHYKKQVSLTDLLLQLSAMKEFNVKDMTQSMLRDDFSMYT